MNRSPIRCAAIAALLLAPVALGAEFREGNEYFRLPVPVETRDPAKIEVVEVFSYGCIHCYQLEPVLNGWLAVQGDDVDFHRLPMATRNLRTLAQAFYTARAMDVLPAVHMPMFENIHEYGIDMSRPQFIRRMFVQQAKVDEEKFASIFDSFAVNTQVRPGRCPDPALPGAGHAVDDRRRALPGRYGVLRHGQTHVAGGRPPDRRGTRQTRGGRERRGARIGGRSGADRFVTVRLIQPGAHVPRS